MATTAASPESARLTQWRWRVFAATWLSYVGFYFCRKPFSIVKADLGIELHFDASDLGVIYATYLIAYAVGQFLSGAISPKFGPRAMLLGGMVVSLGTAVAFGLLPGLAAFIGLMAVNGFAQATGWSNNLGVMAQWFRRDERGKVMGLWSTNFQVGGVAAGALAAFSARQWGLASSFMTGAAVLAVVTVFFWFNQANRPQDLGLPAVDAEPEPAAGQPSAAPQAEIPWTSDTWIAVLLLGIAYFGMKFIRYALWSWAPYVLKLNFGLQTDQAGYVSTIFDVSGIIGVIACGYLSDRYFHSRRAAISMIMLVALIAATALLMTAGTTSVTMFAVSIGLVGFALFGPDALLSGAAAIDVGGSGRGAVRASGIISGLGSAGSALQELLIARSYKASGGAIGPILAMLLGSALLAAAAVAAILARNRQGKSDL